MLSDIRGCIQKLSTPEKAANNRRFFKTTPGAYASKDIFTGVTTPELRTIAHTFHHANIETIQALLHSAINEERCLALIMLVSRYAKASAADKASLYAFYMQHRAYVNNWNLVDISAHWIVGQHLINRDKEDLITLSQSKSLWDRRIAIVATWYFIRQGQCEWTLRLARDLLKDTEDLMHKAAGWMLREVGKKDLKALRDFLNTHARMMPRTMLRYSIEKLPQAERLKYLSGRRLNRISKTA